jgi:hypothetical protein
MHVHVRTRGAQHRRHRIPAGQLDVGAWLVTFRRCRSMNVYRLYGTRGGTIGIESARCMRAVPARRRSVRPDPRCGGGGGPCLRPPRQTPRLVRGTAPRPPRRDRAHLRPWINHPCSRTVRPILQPSCSGCFTKSVQQRDDPSHD